MCKSLLNKAKHRFKNNISLGNYYDHILGKLKGKDEEYEKGRDKAPEQKMEIPPLEFCPKQAIESNYKEMNLIFKTAINIIKRVI